MRSIGANPGIRAEIGIATVNGKAYFRISSLLKRIGLPFIDIIPKYYESFFQNCEKTGFFEASGRDFESYPVRILITTRKEKLMFPSNTAIPIEDLGDDPAVARQRLFAMLSPSLKSGSFVIGIDPGERTGLAAFMNRQEVECVVSSSFEETIRQTSKLLDNAPQQRRIVKIGYGNPQLASRIATILRDQYENRIRIEFVDERGTSALDSKRTKHRATRDQRAAEIIAFRKGILLSQEAAAVLPLN